jgi:hypothetical protein
MGACTPGVAAPRRAFLGGLTVRRLLLIPFALLFVLPAPAGADDTPKAAKTRKKLDKPVTVQYKDTLFKDVEEDLRTQADVTFREDTKGGVNLNAKVTYSAKNKHLGEVLNDICGKLDYGYYVISGNNAYDGSIRITRGKERGYEAGKEPDKTAAKPKEKPKPEVAKEKPEPKEKPAVEDDPDELERVAARRLKVAKELQEEGKAEKARDILQDVVKKYPKTKAAEEAQKLLKDEGT